MINLSFFAKLPFLNVSPGHEFKYQGTPPKRGHLLRVSSMIRGEQIATYLGAKLNPTDGYENDVCIYVKPRVLPPNDFKFEGKPYLDICDSVDLYPLAARHPEVTVISASDWNYDLLKRVLPNKVVNIPEQHCNNERVVRTRSEVTTVGVIGTKNAFEFLPEGLREKLAERGMELLEFSKFFCREDVVDFYKKIDVQIIWRPYVKYHKDRLYNPLKIVNASSFGIPTIALAEKSFEEMGGCYIPVQTLDEFLGALDQLRSVPSIYESYASACIAKSENYHISHIAEKYKQLCQS